MKKSFFVSVGLVVVALLFGFVLAGCGNGTTSGADTDQFTGTWTGTASGYAGSNTFEGPATITISGANWTFSFPTRSINESRTIRFAGASPGATLYQGAGYVGSILLQGGNSITATFNIGAASILCQGFTKQ